MRPEVSEFMTPKAERRYLKIQEVDALLFAAKYPAVKMMLEVLLLSLIHISEPTRRS